MSLDEADYERLQALVSQRTPRLSLNYVVQYAVKQFLERAADPEFVNRLGDPRAR